MKNIMFCSLLALSGGLVIGSNTPAFAMTSFEAVQAPHTLLVNAAAEDMVTGARDFVQDMAQRGINFLSNDSLNQDQRREEFRKLLRSSYDMKTIGRFALGTAWRTATPPQQEEYQRLFEKMIVDVYSRRFSDYKGQKLEVRGGAAQSATDVMVNSFVLPTKGGDEVQVDWRIRYKNGEYKVVDVVVAGVSMAMTQRSDFASVIQRGGGDINVLLEQLRTGAVATKKADAQ